MKKIIIGVVVAVLLGGQVYWSLRNKGSRTYSNAEIGLNLGYPKTWEVLGKDSIDRALSSKEAQKLVTKDVLDAARELAPSLVLTAAKRRVVNGIQQSPNLNIAVLALPESEWPKENVGAFLQEVIDGTQEAVASARFIPNNFPIPDYQPMQCGVIQVPLAGRTVTQVQYVYWRPPHVVVLSFSYSHPDDKTEVHDIAASIRISKTGTSPARP